MRKLIITRKKSCVATLVRMKVYIEDAVTGDTQINGVMCRKIGYLKSGQTAEFEIGENSARVYVVADKLSRNYCNDFADVPAGYEDVYFTGKNKFNYFSGNAFRFDNITSEEVIKNRKKGTRKGLAILIVALIFGIILGLALGDVEEPKTFTDDGMQITLTSNFYEFDEEGFDICYASKEVVLFAIKDEFTALEGLENWTKEEYAKIIIQDNKLDCEPIVNGEQVFFTYKVTNDSNEVCKYIAYIYKTDDAFWFIQFGGLEEDIIENSDIISQWESTIEFS